MNDETETSERPPPDPGLPPDEFEARLNRIEKGEYAPEDVSTGRRGIDAALIDASMFERTDPRRRRRQPSAGGDIRQASARLAAMALEAAERLPADDEASITVRVALRALAALQGWE